MLVPSFYVFRQKRIKIMFSEKKLKFTLHKSMMKKCKLFQQWEVGSDRWIVCDDCDREYHLQCSGIKYRARDYYKLDIDSMEFFCL